MASGTARGPSDFRRGAGSARAANGTLWYRSYPADLAPHQPTGPSALLDPEGGLPSFLAPVRTEGTLCSSTRPKNLVLYGPFPLLRSPIRFIHSNI